MVEITKTATKWGTWLLVLLVFSLCIAAGPTLLKKYRAYKKQQELTHEVRKYFYLS